MPNNNLHKLIIKGVRSSGLCDYLENICEKEHVKILEEYEDSYSFINSGVTFYGLNNLSKNNDYVIMSYSHEKLLFIEHLYNKRLETVNKLEDIYAEDRAYIQNDLDHKMHKYLVDAGWVMDKPKYFFGDLF